MKEKICSSSVIIVAAMLILLPLFSVSETRAASESAKIYISKGWNMISSPFEEPLMLSAVAQRCKLTTHDGKIWAWSYDPAGGWRQLSQVEKDKGIYVLSEENCVVELTGTPPVSYSQALKRGWNLIPGPNGKSFEEAQGDCQIPRDYGIWILDSQTQQWSVLEKTDKFERGKGYWLAVENNCELSAPKNPENKPLVMLFVLKNLTVCGVTDKDECSELKLNDTDILNIKNEATQAMSDIRQWTKGALDFRLKIIEIPTANAQMLSWAGEWTLTPEAIKSAISPLSSKELPDFILVTNGMYDEVRKKAFPPSACGLTFNARVISGATYIWMPKTQNPGTWFECAHKGNYTHELLNGLNYALETVSQVKDIYTSYYHSDRYPLCGKGGPDTYKWFPLASGDHEKDPDYGACGKPSYCKDMEWSNEKCNLEWHKHILEKHYNPKIKFIGNHCRDGIRNFGEVSTDRSTDCDTGR